MKAECTNQQTFQLTEGELLLGKIIYTNLFSYDAEIVLANADCYVAKPRGFFGTSIVVTKNEIEVADLRMNFKGQIVIAFSAGEEFILKNTGIFHNKFVMENKEEKIIQYEPNFNWSKLNYNYNITHNLESQDIVLILLGIYASNYYIAAMAGMV